MNVPEANSLAPLIAAGFYTLLLITPFFRRSRQEKQTKWLFAFIILSIIWEFLRYFEPSIAYPNLPLTTLLVGTALIGVTTAVYVDWPSQQRWLLLGGSAILATILVDIFAPSRTLTLPQTNLPPITYGTLMFYLTWFGLSGFILARTWRNYRGTTFPWHANRLLYWFMALLLTFAGEALIFADLTIVVILGQVVRLIGVVGLAYAVSSYRIFDVRTRSQRALAFVIISSISVLPLIGAILFVQAIVGNLTLAIALLTAVIVTLGFFLYQPFRNFVERATYHYLLGESVNPSKVVRDYSQAISRTLDVQQLSLLIVGTLSELLETNRGALMLVSKLNDGDYQVEPVPAMGRISREKAILSQASLLINTLARQRQPLLQYEIDFNPDYTGITERERVWLKEQAMEAYVPVSAGAELVGLIAIGPKNSAVPYQPGELELVQILADQTVVALQNARLYSELGDQNEKIRHLNVDLIEQNERLEIMDEVKSDFITIASHELRTPLTQVKGYADILSAMNEENALTREQTREIVGHINRATLQLESLITAMLDASQLDVDGLQLTFVKTRLDTVLRLAMEPLIQALRERRISLSMNGIEELPPIQADFKRLVQSFTNIIGNAVKYTPDHGNITVEGKIVPSREKDDEYVEIVVADTGIGIDRQFHELIFEKFFRIGDPQLHSTGSTKFKGAGPGLGLPIAKGVIEAHGGRIWVDSEGEDEERLPGSRFHIILPVQPPGADLAENLESATRAAYLVG